METGFFEVLFACEVCGKHGTDSEHFDMSDDITGDRWVCGDCVDRWVEDNLEDLAEQNPA